jgi:hypothetical protein
VGTHLLNSTLGSNFEVTYCREWNMGVDFVFQFGRAIVGLEVKSGTPRAAPGGMAALRKQLQPLRTLLVGGDVIPLEEFLSTLAVQWLEK